MALSGLVNFFRTKELGPKKLAQGTWPKELTEAGGPGRGAAAEVQASPGFLEIPLVATQLRRMGTINSLERARLARARARAAPHHRRRSPLAWIGRYFGFIAFAGVAIFALQRSGIDWQFVATRQPVSQTGASSTLAGYPRVVDGDTLRLNGVYIRIIGMDAPEMNQTCTDASGRPWACGRVATQQLSALIAGGRIECTAKGRDRYGRTLATCSAGSVSDLGGAMVRAGYAIHYRGNLLAEVEARWRQRGLWAGDFERPQDWRQRHRR